MKRNNSIFIKCACESEGLGVDYDSEDNLYYFSYWSCGFSNKILSIKDRVRYCWKVLTKGKAFNDEIVLTKEDVNRLDNFLLECTREKF